MPKSYDFESVAARCGWTPATQVRVLLNYIDQAECAAAPDRLAIFLKQQELEEQDEPTKQVIEYVTGAGWELVKGTVNDAIRKADNDEVITRKLFVSRYLRDFMETLADDDLLQSAVDEDVYDADFDFVTEAILEKIEKGELSV
jgi:hypothetical protein